MKQTYYSRFMKQHLYEWSNGGSSFYDETVTKAMALDAMLEVGEEFKDMADKLRTELDAIKLTYNEEEYQWLNPIYTCPLYYDDQGNYYNSYQAGEYERETGLSLHKIERSVELSFDRVVFSSIEELAEYLMKMNYSKAKNIKTVINYIERNAGKDKIYGKEFKFRR